MPAAWTGDPAPSVGRSRARTLLAGIGYRFLRDQSVGPLLIDRLREEDWPAGVELEDLSYGPVGVMHNLEDRPPYDRLILISAVRRGREPGSVHRYRWTGDLPGEDEIQARVAEAGAGVISLDNLLVVGTYFRKLPSRVEVVEIEPVDENWGEGFSPAVEAALPRLLSVVRQCVGETA